MTTKSRTLSDNMEDTKDRHRRYQRAIQHPIRRDILRFIEKGATSIVELEKETGIDAKILDWHLNTLEHGFCIEKRAQGDSFHFEITQEGRIVEYLDKKARSS